MSASDAPATSTDLPKRVPGQAISEWWREAVIVYAHGLAQLSACAPTSMPPDQVTWAVNRTHPTGIDSRWQPDTAAVFHGGEPNPGPCDVMPEHRTHYLYAC